MERRDDIGQMREILKDYHKLDKSLFWRDLFINAIIGWPLFFYTVYNPNIITFFIAAFFIYKGTILVHEVSHLAKKIKGYRTAYNILFGWPNSYPAYIGDAHLFHHGKRTYGTKRDPEYKYIEEFNFTILLKPLLSSLILPLFQLVRFAIFPFIEILLPFKMKLKVYKSISTLAFDMDYRRPVRNEKAQVNQMLKNDLMCGLYNLIILSLLVFKILPIETLAIWYGTVVICSLLNMYRALFNHMYTNKSLEPMSWEDHLLDTVTIDAGPIANMIFVNGLNYHAIHHLFPELPYTNLKAAHRKLMKDLPEDHIYKKNTFHSLRKLVNTMLFKKRSLILDKSFN